MGRIELIDDGQQELMDEISAETEPGKPWTASLPKNPQSRPHLQCVAKVLRELLNPNKRWVFSVKRAKTKIAEYLSLMNTHVMRLMPMMRTITLSA